MATARNVLTAMSLTALLLTSVPGLSQSRPANAGPDCSSRPEEPPVPAAPGAPGQHNPGSGASDCSRGHGPGSDSQDESSKEQDMKSNEGNFAAVAALLAAVASGSAYGGSVEVGFSIEDCRIQSARDAISHTVQPSTITLQGEEYQTQPVTAGVPGQAQSEVCRLLQIVTDGLLNVGPKACVGGNSATGAVFTATGDGYVLVQELTNGTKTFEQKLPFNDDGTGVDGSMCP
jgi:hypothetical protein